MTRWATGRSVWREMRTPIRSQAEAFEVDPAARETWQERDQLDRLKRELDVPVTQIVTESEEGRHGE